MKPQMKASAFALRGYGRDKDEHRCFFELLVCEQAENIEENSVVRKFRITAANGNQYNTNFKPLEFDRFKNSYKKLKGGLL